MILWLILCAVLLYVLYFRKDTFTADPAKEGKAAIIKIIVEDNVRNGHTFRDYLIAMNGQGYFDEKLGKMEAYYLFSALAKSGALTTDTIVPYIGE